MILILEIVVALCIVCVVALGINKIEDSKKDYMSFREALALAELPIVTFNQGDVKMNFILDTGANNNIIDERIIGLLQTVETQRIGRITGIGGKREDIPFKNLTFTYKNKEFNDDFQVINMSHTFDAIKTATGVTAHGIIGNAFMQKNKYVLDFKEMVAYSRK